MFKTIIKLALLAPVLVIAAPSTIPPNPAMINTITINNNTATGQTTTSIKPTAAVITPKVESIAIAKPKKAKVAAKPKTTYNNYSMDASRFDWKFNGSAEAALYDLRRFVPSLVITSPVGTRKASNISVDNTNITLSDALKLINEQLQGQADVVFDGNSRNVKLVYLSETSKEDDPIKLVKSWKDGKTPLPVLS